MGINKSLLGCTINRRIEESDICYQAPAYIHGSLTPTPMWSHPHVYQRLSPHQTPFQRPPFLQWALFSLELLRIYEKGKAPLLVHWLERSLERNLLQYHRSSICYILLLFSHSWWKDYRKKFIEEERQKGWKKEWMTKMINEC